MSPAFILTVKPASVKRLTIATNGDSNTLRPLPDLTFTVPDEAEVTHLPAQTEGLGAFEVNVMQIAVVYDVTAAEHRTALPVPTFYTEQHTGRSSPY